MKEEIKRGKHLHPTRGGLCRSPKCGCFANANKEEFEGYCCKQCGLRQRERDHGIVYDNPKPYQLELHGLRCQGRTPLRNQKFADEGDEAAENKPEVNKKRVARDYWGCEGPVHQPSTAIVGATAAAGAIQQMRITEALPP